MWGYHERDSNCQTAALVAVDIMHSRFQSASGWRALTLGYEQLTRYQLLMLLLLAQCVVH